VNIYGAAVATNDSSYITVDNNYHHEGNFELAYIYGSIVPYSTRSGSNITITNNRLVNITTGTNCSPSCAEADGIVVSRADTVTIAYNTINGVQRCWAKIEGSQNVNIHHNIAQGGKVGYPALQVAPAGANGARNIANVNITIDSNSITGPNWELGVQINSSDTLSSIAKNITIRNNTISSVGSGVLMDGNVGLDTISISQNTFNSMGVNAIYVNGGGTNLGITGNTRDSRAIQDVFFSTFTREHTY
jgi:hypothetical protein